MDQLRTYGDKRELACCVYCGSGAVETRDHVPSRVLLDEPYPSNLPVVPACGMCNQGFSLDEEYLACLVECVICGSSAPNLVTRPKVRRILADRPALAAQLAEARMQAESTTCFGIEDDRVRKVVLKLARGHAAFELHSPQFDEPREIVTVPLQVMSFEARSAFERHPGTSSVAFWPEVGSRAMQRRIGIGETSATGWITAQQGRYRYFAASTDQGIVVRSVLSEYLACEVIWSN